MPKSKPRNLAGLVIPFFLATCLIAGYWFYWFNAATQIESRVRAALPAPLATSVSVTGFPYRLTLTVRDLALNVQDGVRFQAPSLVATATPFNPMLWVLEGVEKPSIAFRGGPMRTVTATALKASLRLRPQGLERFSLTFDSLAGVAPTGSGVSDWASGRGLVHVMSSATDTMTLGFVAQASAIQLSKPLEGSGAILGQAINNVRIAGPIKEGQTLLASPNAWRQKGGYLSIMTGEVIWGPVSLTNATGKLSLGADNRFVGRIDGQGALKPEGIAVAGLSGPVGLAIEGGEVSVAGLAGFDLTNIFR